MKKWTSKIISIMVISVMIISVGCSSDNSNIQKNIDKAKEEMANKEYGKAEAILEIVLDEDSSNEEASNLFLIVSGYEKAKKVLDDKKYEESKKILDKINEDYKIYSIKEDIDNLKSQVDKIIETRKQITNMISEVEQLFNEEKYSEVVDYINNTIWGEATSEIREFFTEEEKRKVNQLLSDSSSKVEEQQRKEEEERQKAEQQRKEEENKKVQSSEITEEEAMSKIKSLNELSYLSGKSLSFMEESIKPEGMEGYAFQVGINGEERFETLGFYFVSNKGETYKMNILNGSYEPVD